MTFQTAQTEIWVYSEIIFLSLTQSTFHCPFFWKGVVFDTCTIPWQNREIIFIHFIIFIFFWKISLFDCFYIYISFSYIWNLKKKKSIRQNYKIYGENKKTCFQQTPLGSHSIYNFRNDTLGNLEGKQIFLLSKKSLY